VEAVGRPGPDWGHWGYNEATLPAAFHKRTGSGSLGNVLSWVKGKPLSSFDGKAPGYRRVEKALLVMGLTLREMDRVLFSDPDDAGNLSDCINNSLLTLVDLDKVVEGCNDLLREVGLDEPVTEPEEEANTIAEPSASRYVIVT
jgi:hypothetical protein